MWEEILQKSKMNIRLVHLNVGRGITEIKNEGGIFIKTENKY